jgi:hypothetical protein
MDREQVNGFSNYSTWLVALWLDNDFDYMLKTDDLLSDYKDKHDLAEALKKIIGDDIPEIDGMWLDLIRNQLDGQVDFVQIAEKLLDY